MNRAFNTDINPMEFLAQLSAALPGLPSETAEKFLIYYKMLIDWNTRMNLTAITDERGAAQRHFADSLLWAELIPRGASCIDVGTGAGFPGLPLKLIRPDIELTLLDSLNKRVTFLNSVLDALDVRADTVHSRAEDAGKNPLYREKFDIALSRGVAGANVLAELTLPFVKVGGASLMYKGQAAQKELTEAANALSVLGARAELMQRECDWGSRALIIARKTAHTPAQYPRKAGTAGRAPLK